MDGEQKQGVLDCGECEKRRMPCCLMSRRTLMWKCWGEDINGSKIDKSGVDQSETRRTFDRLRLILGWCSLKSEMIPQAVVEKPDLELPTQNTLPAFAHYTTTLSAAFLLTVINLIRSPPLSPDPTYRLANCRLPREHASTCYTVLPCAVGGTCSSPSCRYKRSHTALKVPHSCETKDADSTPRSSCVEGGMGGGTDAILLWSWFIKNICICAVKQCLRFPWAGLGVLCAARLLRRRPPTQSGVGR